MQTNWDCEELCLFLIRSDVTCHQCFIKSVHYKKVFCFTEQWSHVSHGHFLLFWFFYWLTCDVFLDFISHLESWTCLQIVKMLMCCGMYFFYQFMHVQFAGNHPMIFNSKYHAVLLKNHESKQRKCSSSIVASIHSPNRSSSESGVCPSISGPRPGTLWTDGQSITGHTDTFIHRDDLVSSFN